jgi:hypothetical protein
MQSAEMRLCEGPTGALNFARDRCVPTVPFAKRNDMVEHFSPDRANQPFNISVLPWRSRCRWSVANAHRAKPPGVCLAIGTIAITHDIIRRSLRAANLR